jgi:hypothetical protein
MRDGGHPRLPDQASSHSVTNRPAACICPPCPPGTSISKGALYLVLSLVCSAITEAFARAFAMRSRTLKSGIRNLLSDPDGKGLAKLHETSRSELDERLRNR